jgi:hypothetical protein
MTVDLEPIEIEFILVALELLQRDYGKQTIHLNAAANQLRAKLSQYKPIIDYTKNLPSPNDKLEIPRLSKDDLDGYRKSFKG